MLDTPASTFALAPSIAGQADAADIVDDLLASIERRCRVAHVEPREVAFAALVELASGLVAFGAVSDLREVIDMMEREVTRRVDQLEAFGLDAPPPDAMRLPRVPARH